MMKKMMTICFAMILSLIASNANASSIYDLIGETIKGCKVIDVVNWNYTDYFIICIKKDKNGEFKTYYQSIHADSLPKNEKITVEDVNNVLRRK